MKVKYAHLMGWILEGQATWEFLGLRYFQLKQPHLIQHFYASACEENV